MMETIEGTIESVVYRNDENGYSVLTINADNNLITAVGAMPPLGEGERVRIKCCLSNHIVYGKQYNVKSIEKLPPDGEEGIIRYLSSGIIKGIGKVTAKRIVNALGIDTLDIIRNNPQRLQDISGIGKAKGGLIAATLHEHIKMQDNMVFLQSLQVPLNIAARVCHHYKGETRKIIETTPYKLAYTIDGIGFLRADKIALQLGHNIDSPARLVAGISYVLMEAAKQDGHTCLPIDELKKKASNILHCPQDALSDAIIEAITHRDIVLREYDNIEYLYLPIYDEAEREVSASILTLTTQEFPSIGIDIEEASDLITKMQGMELSSQQKQAVQAALSGGITVITGGPGTGKTTTINCLIWALEQVNIKVLLGAPTGRAAKRMSEATGKEAKTIHRLLEYGYSEDETRLSFNRDAENALDCSALIIDETSMVDILLMQHLLRAVPNDCRLILVGDADQLPSVGAGNVLRDIIDSGKAKIAKLDKIFRQAQQSLIVMNAHKINNGIFPDLKDRKKDFFFVKEYDESKIIATVIDMAKNRIPKYLKCDALRDIQILSPVKRSALGVENLNIELQKVFNDKKSVKEKSFGTTTYRVGDKVMQIKNNYQMKWRKRLPNGAYYNGEGVFNGDTGFIIDIDYELQIMSIEYDDNKTIDYNFNELEEIMLAYAVTIHKSQGSEYDVIILPLLNGPPMLMTRNLLYTAVTRAKRMVVIIGDEGVIRKMVDNDLMKNRYSCLTYALNSMI